MKKTLIAAALILSTGILSANALTGSRDTVITTTQEPTKKDIGTADTKKDIGTADTKKDIGTAD
jgi:hypothetical protein